jgi:hypothetical protein
MTLTNLQIRVRSARLYLWTEHTAVRTRSAHLWTTDTRSYHSNGSTTHCHIQNIQADSYAAIAIVLYVLPHIQVSLGLLNMHSSMHISYAVGNLLPDEDCSRPSRSIVKELWDNELECEQNVNQTAPMRCAT